MYCAYSTNAYISTNTYIEIGPLSPAGVLLAHSLHLTLIALTVQCNDGQVLIVRHPCGPADSVGCDTAERYEPRLGSIEADTRVYKLN